LIATLLQSVEYEARLRKCSEKLMLGSLQVRTRGSNRNIRLGATLK